MRSAPVLRTALAAALPFAAYAADGKSTRYWDCCKPSCAWPGKALVNQPVYACSANFQRLTDPNVKSGCDGGSAFSCADQSPWAINDNLSYGFAATSLSGGSEASWCCACYELTFTSGPVAGKKMVVQSTSTGGDLGTNHFDLNIPGGGVGLFDGCTPQFGGLPGAQYGGVSSRSQCDSFPAALKPGCYWRFDWFKNADNPTFSFRQVQCPSELVARTGCRRNDDSSFPVFTPGSGSATSSARPTSTTSARTSTSTSGAQTSSPAGCVAQKWAQCGGSGFSGCKTCVAGTTCQAQNQWYSQCI
ncbi:carbohydrate-binding module family 1 protein [Parathielavia appendiculata]|uniref:Cellulase n=1 Tax=Parathielavia appendiculata TaxID=2587402 RepID=A0AAN6YZQ3_9PEZI|nr:carbohydrate-binding module family 1 protein [Parathielavia appendiculata]